jgi:TrmH family RNA methyltransferase
MISKAKAKYIKSLQVKKYRIQEQRFLVEGAKSVEELLRSAFSTEWVVATPAFLQKWAKSLAHIEILEATENELAHLGTLQSNDAALAVAQMKPNQPVQPQAGEWMLALDDIRDPGNLGTIVRTADWYGVRHIIASVETADFYNPKTIIATMGSFCRVNVYYTDLPAWLPAASESVYGTFLDGASVHTTHFGQGGVIVIGNESKGISAAVEQHVAHRITIPRWGHAESLNAGIATAIVLDNIRRSQK